MFTLELQIVVTHSRQGLHDRLVAGNHRLLDVRQGIATVFFDIRTSSLAWFKIAKDTSWVCRNSSGKLAIVGSVMQRLPGALIQLFSKFFVYGYNYFFRPRWPLLH
jgi:hypothetical protein